MKKTDSLGQLEQLTLTAAALLGEDAYGVTIGEKIFELAGKKINRGALHVTLERLVDKGYLSSALGDPTPERGGKPKRYYKLLTAGGLVLRDAANLSRNLADVTDTWWSLFKPGRRKA